MGGIPEIMVEGRSEFLYPDRDVPALTAHLLQLFQHPESWPEMGRAGRRHVEENYVIRRIVERLAASYQSLATHNRSASS